MGFKRVKYTTDGGTVVFIRASDATIAVIGNTAVSAAVDDGAIYAYASNPGSKRKKQLNARGLRLKRLVGAAPNQFNRTTFLPVFTKTAFDTYVLDSDLAVDGTTWKIGDKISEA